LRLGDGTDGIVVNEVAVMIIVLVLLLVTASGITGDGTTLIFGHCSLDSVSSFTRSTLTKVDDPAFIN
jgi:hypothetical protein